MSLSPQDNTIAIVITCHNYGKYLAEAIESVLHQTTPVSEIVVVDDASDDNTKEVALQYAQNGVRYIRGDWLSPGCARNAGLLQTTAPYLVFLDADDLLHTEYLRCGIDVMQSHPDAAIAYTDYQCFGDRDELYRRPEVFDWEHFDMVGDLSDNSMLRRDALLQAGTWPTGKNVDITWILFRRILGLGWNAKKSRGLFFYRVHHGSRFGRMMQYPYAERTGLLDEPMSVLVALSGNREKWQHMRHFLETQTFPHEDTHLFVLDNSYDNVFGTAVRTWIGQSDYPTYSYLPAKPAPGTGKEHERVRLLNTAIRMTTTPLIWILGDTPALPPSAYRTLVSRFQANVLAVSTSCSGKCTEEGTFCFCCVVIRGGYMHRTVLRSGPPLYRLEDNFFHSVGEGKRYQVIIEPMFHQNPLPSPSFA